MARKKSTNDDNNLSIDISDPIHVTHIEITDEPIREPAYQRLPKAVKETLDILHYEAHLNPQQAIPELLKLKKKYPYVPQIYNYLAVAYSIAGEREKAEAITQENIRKNPKYLFARINQAQIFIENKEYEKIPELFQNKYDLKLLYPKRKKFHISEVVNFMGIMGLYFAKTHQRDIAEKYHEIVQEIAPDYPIVKMLKRELHPGIVSRAIKKLLETRD